MGDILNFKPRKFEEVWECACGSQRFYIVENMRLECCACGDYINNLLVTEIQPDKPDGNAPTN